MKMHVSMRLVVGLSVVALLCGGAVAVNAATTSTSTTYYACLKGGTLAEVGVKAPTCTNGATLIKWGAAGPRGKTGARGPAGAAGPTGPTGSAGATGQSGAAGRAGATGAAGSGYGQTTSNATITIETGSLTFTGVADTGAYVVGQRVRVIATSSPADYVEGNITALSIDYSITVNVDTMEGPGTFTGWTFAVAGDVGATGPAGASGEDCSATPYPGIDLAGCDFSDQSVSTVNFTDADLAGANFVGANLADANLTGADLSEANLTGATVSGADFLYANLTGATFTNVNIPTGTQFGGADLQDTDFGQADLNSYVSSGGNYGSPVLPNGWSMGTISDVIGEVLEGPGGEYEFTDQFALCLLDPTNPNCVI
jgi:uncharacterized protein YjbI with pentapeptide repeats